MKTAFHFQRLCLLYSGQHSNAINETAPQVYHLHLHVTMLSWCQNENAVSSNTYVHHVENYNAIVELHFHFQVYSIILSPLWASIGKFVC